MGVYENARKSTTNKIIETFWEMYRTRPINHITVKELSFACNIGRGTFYNHFQDVYAVLEKIEEILSYNLEKMQEDLTEKKSDLIDFSQILYTYYSDKTICDYINVLILNYKDPVFAQNYLSILKELLAEVCTKESTHPLSIRDKTIVDGALSSIINILLNCICNTDLSLSEINELIKGLLQNGYYITLTNRFGIDVLKNPF